MAVLSNQVGKQLLEALGLEMAGVRAVTLVFEADRPVEIHVKYLPGEDAVGAVAEMLTSYELHKKPD